MNRQLQIAKLIGQNRRKRRVRPGRWGNGKELHMAGDGSQLIPEAPITTASDNDEEVLRRSMLAKRLRLERRR